MSCIHYKFKSSLDYNSVTFDGLHLSLGDLKKAISSQKRLKQGEFELEIINAQTGDVYKKSDELIGKNTSVIVSRVPVTKTNTTSTQRSWEAFKQECAKVKQQEREKMLELEKQQKVAEASTVLTSEMDKIKAVIDQSTKGFEPHSFQGRHPHAVPYDNYVCKRCGNKGHYITNCPNIKQEDRVIEPRVKRTTGIPSTMLTIVDDPLHPGALLTHQGHFAVPTVDVAGYRDSKKDQPPFSGENKEPEVEKKIIPTELLCHICEDLCVDAAIAPCCGTSFCDECLREELLESEDHQCPSCHETNVSPDRIVANRSMRIAVTNFLNDTGYSKVKRRRSSSTSGDASSIFPQAPRPPSPPPPAAPVITSSESISSVVSAVPSTASLLEEKESSFPKHPEDNYNSRPFRGDHSTSYRPWQRHESPYDRPPDNASWNGQMNTSKPPPFMQGGPPPRMVAAVASHALQALVRSRLPPPLPFPPPFLGMPGYPPQLPRGLNAPQPISPVKKKPVDVFDSFADFTKKRSRTPELKSHSRSRSGSPHRRSPHSSYSPAKKGSHGRSPRRSSLSRSRSRSRTGSFQRSRSRGRSLKKSRSKSPPRRRRSGSAESRGLSELRSLSPDSITKRSKSPSRSPRPTYRSRSRSGSFKRTYRSRSRSWSKSKKARNRSYSPISPRQLRRSPNRSPRRSPNRSPRRSLNRSPRRSPARRSPYRSPRSSLKSPGRSPLYSPIRSRSRRSFTPRRRSQSFSPRRRSKSRSPFSKHRPAYARSRSRTPPRKRSPSPYGSNRRSPSPYNKARSPSPYHYRGGRGRDSKYPREDRTGGPNRPHSPPRRPGNAPPPPHANASAAGANLPPVQLLPNMALPPPEEYFKHNPAGYEEFLRTFYAQVGNQANPYGGPPDGVHHHPQPGPPYGNSYPPGGQPNGPLPHPHSGFPQDRRQAPWDPAGSSMARPRSISPMGRTSSHSPKFGDRYRRDAGRPGFDSRGGGRDRDKDRRFDRYNERGNNRRGADRADDLRQDDNRYDQRYEDRKWRGDNRDKRTDESKDKKFIPSEIRDRRGARDGDKRSRDADKNRSIERSKDGGKTKERTSIEKKRSPQHTSKLSEKNRKGEERKRKEEKENAESKAKSVVEDKNGEVKKEEPKTLDRRNDGEPETKVAPLEDIVETTKENIPDATEGNNQIPKETAEKEKKVPGKKKVGAAGKKLKAKGANAVDGEKKEKKTKKKKLTFGASEADAKGLKKKKLKRVVDYKSENTPTTEDAADPEKSNLSEPSPTKKAKMESDDVGDLSAEKMESSDDTNPSKNDPVVPQNDTQETPNRDVSRDEDAEMTSPPQRTTKSGLVTELPELSKWEREDDFDIPVVEKADEKPKEKSSLPRSVVDKAEMFIVGKPMKNSVIAAPVTSIENKPVSLEKHKDVIDRPRDVQSKNKNVFNKEKHREVVPNRPKERETFDKREERHKGVSERHRPPQEDRREDVSDRRKDYRDHRSKSPLHARDYSSNRPGNNKDFRSKSPVYNKDYRPKSPIALKDHRSKSPIQNKDYRSRSPVHGKDYRSKSPIRNDYRSKSPIRNDYRSKSPLRNDYRTKSPMRNDYRSKSPMRNDYRTKSPLRNDYRSKSPMRNDYKSKSPIHASKDYRSTKSPSERSRKVSIDSKKDHKERKGLDIQITVKGDRDRPNKKSSSGGGDAVSDQRYQDRGHVSEEDERSVIRSHSIERETKSKGKGRKKEKEDSKRKGEKELSSKLKCKKSKGDSEEKDHGDTGSSKKMDHLPSNKEDMAPHRSPRDLRHKLEEKTKAQNKSQNTGGHQRKLSVMDESEFVPDYEDTLATEALNAAGSEEGKGNSVSPGKGSSPEQKEDGNNNETSDDKSSEEEESKEVKKHKKSKKKHKHKEKKDKKEKHKHKKKKHKKNKEKDES